MDDVTQFPEPHPRIDVVGSRLRPVSDLRPKGHTSKANQAWQPTDAVSPSGLSSATGSDDLQRSLDLLSLVGKELAEPLTAALERVNALVGSGRIDRAGLRALLDEVDRARQVGISCQQIARLASGRARQSHERLSLTQVLGNVLALRARELQAGNINISAAMVPVEVLEDAPLLHAMLNALVDWCLACAQGDVQLGLSLSIWPVEARLTIQLQHKQADASDELPPDSPSPAVQGLSWALLTQTARAMGVKVSQKIEPNFTHVSFSFARTVNPNHLDEEPREEEASFLSSMNSRPLAGSHVLVVASSRDLRLRVREATKPMGLVLDFVSSINEARAFCAHALPHAIVFESGLRGSAFDHLVIGIRREVPKFVLLELLEAGDTFDISSTSPTGVARIGREAIIGSMQSALVYELSNAM